MLQHVRGRSFSPLIRASRALAGSRTTACTSRLPSPAAWAPQRCYAATAAGTDASSSDPAYVRNIGIIAHIDAGKTTTSERMLYHAGVVRRMGDTDVDDGDTVLDFLEQERERGITINSAAISFPWRNCSINLIDTPGHVDFTMEVERTLRVMDGAVAVIDAVAGVQAQTETVWRQADRYGVRRIAFINKMDRVGADYAKAAASITKRFALPVLCVDHPVFHQDVYQDSISLLDPLDTDAVADSAAIESRQHLLEEVCGLDDDFATAYLDVDGDQAQVPSSMLLAALRRITLHQTGVVALCGSAFRNQGVPAVLDAVVDLLPSPLEVPAMPVAADVSVSAAAAAPNDPMVALAFKVQYDPSRSDTLVFLRVYSGVLQARSQVSNASRGVKERINKLIVVAGDQYREVDKALPGSVVAAVGLKTTCTGDSLILGPKHTATWLMPGVPVPDPVFQRSIEPESAAGADALDRALAIMQREDPSLRVWTDPDTAQTILAGMGELHLDIAVNRLQRTFRINANVGGIQIAYRETPTDRISVSHTLDTLLAGRRHRVGGTMTLTPTSPSQAAQAIVSASLDAAATGGAIKSAAEAQAVLASSLESALGRGPILGFPLHGVRAELSQLELYAGESDLTALRLLIPALMVQAGRAGAFALLQPVMRVSVQVPDADLGAVLSDLTGRRRGTVLSVEAPSVSGLPHEIDASVPLCEMVGYSTVLRSLTHGAATFSMFFHAYDAVVDQDSVVQQLRGF